MTSDLQLDPSLDHLEASARMPDGKVAHPSPQHRVDQLHYPRCGLRPMPPKDFLESLHERRAFLQLRRNLRPPRSATAERATEVEPQKSEALAPGEVHHSALVLVDLDFEFGKLLSQSLDHRLMQPVMARMGIHEYHQIVSKPRIFDLGVLSSARQCLRPLQHPGLAPRLFGLP